MANRKIQDIEGIGPAYGDKLSGAGITDTDGLLDKGCTRKGRKALAEASGLTEKQILKFVNMADLFRIKGVGPEYAELLECAGVDTVKELATRKPENLTAKMLEVNGEKNLTRQPPSESAVKGWVDEAKGLPGKVEY